MNINVYNYTNVFTKIYVQYVIYLYTNLLYLIIYVGVFLSIKDYTVQENIGSFIALIEVDGFVISPITVSVSTSDITAISKSSNWTVKWTI